MNEFAHLLDRLAYEPRRNAKLRMLQDYFARTPDPERGYALGAMTGTLSFREAKPALIRGLVEERIDPVLFRLSHNYVGDLAETTALIWPGPTEAPREPGPGHNNPPPHVPTLAEVVETLATIPKRELPRHLADWLDALDETGRWALLKLVTGNLRVGVSARLAKTAVGALGGHDADAVEEVWHGLTPPFETLFAWVEGRAERPETLNPAPFRPPMLSHPIEEEATSRSWRSRPSRPSGSGTASASSSSAVSIGPASRLGRSIPAPARTSPGRSRTSPRPSPSRAPSTASC